MRYGEIMHNLYKQTVRGSSTDQVLGLFLNNHEFKFLQDHWKLIWSLTSGPVGLVEVDLNWPEDPC